MSINDERVTFSELAHFSPKQEEAYKALKNNKYLLYGGAMGGGKALVLDSEVWTPFGAKKIGDIKVGDVVSNPDGTQSNVIRVTKPELREVFEVKTADGRSVVASDDHLWLVKIASGKTKQKVVTTQWMYEYLNKRKERGRSAFHLLLPLTKEVQFTLPNKLPIDPYLLGVLIGDGCFRGSGLTFTSIDSPIIENVQERVESIRQYNKYTYGVKSDGIKKHLKKMNLWGEKSEKKFIPKQYKYSSTKNRFELVQGLMDTDGFVDERGHCSFTSSSEQLAKDFQWVVWSLGYKATIQIKKTTHLDAYTVHIQGENTERLFKLARKIERCKKYNGGVSTPSLRVISITPKGKQMTRCITVDNPNGLFLTNDFIVTHNSYFLRWASLALLLRWAKQGYTNVTVGIFCEDYPTLKDRHLSKISKEFPSWIGTLHSDHKEYGKSFILAPEYGSGVIVFRNLDDPSKYASAEFAAIAVDELTKNDKETFDDLRTRLRWPNIQDVKFLSATNPGSKGHAWVKQFWIDRKFEENEAESDLFVYVQALAKDNPHLDPSYVQSLAGLPEDKRKAFLEGDWDIFKGQYFTEFKKNLHVIKPFFIPDGWKRYISMDYGYSAPSAVLWHAVDHDGVVYTYRELYVRNLTYSQLAKEIITCMTPDELQFTSFIVADPAIWAKKGETELSGYEIMWNTMKELGIRLNFVKGNNDRINGWNTVREYLKPFAREDNVIAKLQIFETCTELVRTLPSLVYDKHKTEDLDSDGEDHCADSLRYFLMSRPSSTKLENNHRTLSRTPPRNIGKFISGYE